ncbi:BCL2/adenovirus E1B 19 kDa protein-interacting protein 3-like [Osmerus eperlanus]|uniref:BCL2/adenovirus E1B 19 kDa protein-interacting protein 3-like n=1 Tax=Osmerus eperlanus TaxID=29151 RepID=UPI002E10A36B
MSERSGEENLQGSWVELHFNSSPAGGAATQPANSQEAEKEDAPESTQGEELISGSAETDERVPGSPLDGEPASGSILTLDGENDSGSIQGGEQVPGLDQADTQAASQGLDLEKMLLEAQHESGRSSSRGSVPCDSPPRSQTPLHLRRGSEVPSSAEKNSSQSEEDYLDRRREVENLMKKNADWIWDWSSRPENLPPKEFLLKHPKRATPLSIRNTRVMKKGGIFSADFVKVFLPSLLLSHILAIGLGVYIGRRLAPPSSSF